MRLDERPDNRRNGRRTARTPRLGADLELDRPAAAFNLGHSFCSASGRRLRQHPRHAFAPVGALGAEMRYDRWIKAQRHGLERRVELWPAGSASCALRQSWKHFAEEVEAPRSARPSAQGCPDRWRSRVERLLLHCPSEGALPRISSRSSSLLLLAWEFAWRSRDGFGGQRAERPGVIAIPAHSRRPATKRSLSAEAGPRLQRRSRRRDWRS